jgi:hypothetical protein
MDSFLLIDLRKIESALAIGDVEAAKIILYAVITREEAAQHSVEPTLKKCPSCGADEDDCFVWCPRGN